MMDRIFSFSSMRKRLPLPMRMAYGWLRRKFVPDPIWDKGYFKHLYQWLLETQWWSRIQLEELQLEQLRALVKHAYENVPYYRRVFDEHRLSPKDIVTLDDLQKIPFLTKEDVRNNFEDLIARNIDRERLDHVTTAGSTGSPLGLYHDKITTKLREAAFALRQCDWAGYSRSDRIATLMGDLINRVDRKGKQCVWDYNTEDNKLVLLAQDMSEENMYKDVEKIRQFKPKFILGYPSSLEILASFMRRNGITDIQVNAIFCISETLYPRQRELIESHFRCKIFDRYGLTEYVASAAECEQHEGYHINMEYGILELIDKDGIPITEAGSLRRVVGTGFGNYCMPLLRYVTDDLAEYRTGQCSCKRQSILIKAFKGRIQEFVVSKTGQLVPFSAVYVDFGISKPVWGKIRELKFIQEREGELIVEMALADSSLESETAQEFVKGLYDRLDEQEFQVNVIFVDSVSRKERGKLGLLEQNIPINLEEFNQTKNQTTVATRTH